MRKAPADDALRMAAAELPSAGNDFVVIEERRRQGGVGEALALLLPEARVWSAAADQSWPKEGGDHEEVMAQVGLDLRAVCEAVERARRPPGSCHSGLASQDNAHTPA